MHLSLAFGSLPLVFNLMDAGFSLSCLLFKLSDALLRLTGLPS